MRYLLCVCCITSLLTACSDSNAPAAPRPRTDALTHTGMCDASAAIAVGDDRFLVANDEDNVLRLYDAKRDGPAVKTFDLSRFLLIDRKNPEADLEGVARLGDRVYWIGSHGRNKNGKQRLNRHVFFATTVKEKDGEVSVEPIGKPFTKLVEFMLADPQLRELGLREAVQPEKQEDDDLAPKEDGLNIESLAAAPDGKGLLIGFRNPRPNGRAIVLPLLNPAQVIDGNADPQFGEPMLLALEGDRGVRAMTWSPAIKAYLLIAGPHTGRDAYDLFRWTGRADDEPKRITKIDLPDFTPEAIVCFGDNPSALIIADAGSVAIAGVECKDVKDPAKRRFFSTRIDVAK